MQNAGSWVAHTDDDGETYFYNSRTGESTWSRPMMSRKREYWGMVTDPRTSQVFYFNKVTGEKTTKKPIELTA